MNDKRYLVVITGPTAIGKTGLTIHLAQQFQTHILSADSRQFYREMEIGTAKPTSEELAAVPHHFINTHSIQDFYSAGAFSKDALQLLESLFPKHPTVFATGGSGLYLQALTDGLDEMPTIKMEEREALSQTFREQGLEPLLAELKEKDPTYYEQVDRKNHARVIRALEIIRSVGKPYSSLRTSGKAQRPFDILKIALDMPRKQLYERINKRVDQMLENGLVEEARKLHPHRGLNALETVGYKELFDHFEGQYDLKEAIRLIKRNSRRYAKRQLTWLRRDKEYQWFSPNDKEKIKEWIAAQTGHSSA